MAIFKCKMCGGSLEITDGATVCECEYCGTQQTLPKTNDEQTLNMLNRANHFRQQCEFDKALEIYERLLNNSAADAEIYWSLVLCRYGIEYVDDPLTKKKIPTCHRTQFKSILEDADYLEALSHADPHQKELYKNEADYIDSVQKGILEISNKEEPFDVFICYKESDDSGKRTPDSVLAQDLYYQLEREGFKVFFSRITLEGKLGTAYEPYIFAALNSAKVMVVVGTKPEYFNAVWVKNEWSRYLMLMQEDRSRTLIPAYKDMDPYDLPDALSMFQAQDMSKLGFMQDLIRGINKILKSENKIENIINENDSNFKRIQPLLKRAYMFLEDGEWDNADTCSEKVLDLDPECSEAYFLKLLINLKIKSKDELKNQKNPFNDNVYYIKTIKFANEQFKRELQEYSNERIYQEALNKYKKQNYTEASEIFKSISGYKDSDEKANECIYTFGMLRFDKGLYSDAESLFNQIPNYKDSNIMIEKCKEIHAQNPKSITNKNSATLTSENSYNYKHEKDIRIDKQQADKILENAVDALMSDSITTVQKSIKDLSGIKDWKNACELLESCKGRIKSIIKNKFISLLKYIGIALVIIIYIIIWWI